VKATAMFVGDVFVVDLDPGPPGEWLALVRAAAEPPRVRVQPWVWGTADMARWYDEALSEAHAAAAPPEVRFSEVAFWPTRFTP
jgi:hypothetical protein